MESFISLVSRNNKVFRRDKTQVFFSMLSVVIVIALYAIFLQKMQVDAIEQVTAATPAAITMVNEWLVAGLLSMIGVTTTLAAFGIAVQDIESKAAADFLTAPISRAKIQLSYVVNAFMIGLAFSLLALVACEIFIVAMGGALLSLDALLKVLCLLVLTVLLASAFNMLLVLLVRTVNAFSTLSTIIGTAIGFLCGLYVPIGVLPALAQNLVMYFPLSHSAVLLREAFMADSMTTVFEGAPAEVLEEYKLMYGVLYEMNGTVLSYSTSIWIMAGAAALFAVLAIVIFKYKNK